MNELQKINRAKIYLENLANGVNPLTDQPVGENDIVNNVRISRCLFYVSDILGKIVENKESSRSIKRTEHRFQLQLNRRLNLSFQGILFRFPK